MAKHGEEVRDALVRQWQAITAAAATIDLEIPSRVTGWRNREVVAHLCLLSISFDPELGDAVRSAAAQAGKPLSSWLAEAAASKLRAEALAEFLDGWEAEHGVLTAQELARAERELGMAGTDSPA